ncbi:MAG: hypothetical protein JW741_08200 [Sedimentisphaerales bacterium]|nr:hypothetical protein [Sedimentisphaerales bacterium]
MYPYTDHVNRWSDLGILILLARSFVLREQEGQRLLAMNIDKMLTCHMHDVMYGGLFTKTDFAWCNPFPAKVLLTQFRCIELLIDSLRRYQARPYKHIVQWTLGCCLRDFLHPEAGLFVPSRSYMSSGGSLIHWTIGDFSECLSADDLQFLEDTLDLETVRRSQDKGCPVRLKRLDLGDSEFERLQRLVQEVGTRKRRDIDLPPAQPPLMYDNAHAARILLDAGVYLGNHELEILGLEILDCLWTAFDGDTGKLASTFHDGCWQGAATLIDYAFLTQALLAGYTHTLRPAYLERAEAVHQATLSRFWHEEHGTFRVFSRTYTKQLDALRGTDFLGGVGVAFKNHVLFSRYRGEDPAAFIRNVFNIFCNGLVHGADEEYTEIVDFLNGCALMTPVRVMCSRSDSEMWRELVLQVHQLPPYCRRNIIMLDAHHKQAEVFRQQGPADGEVAPDAIWVWPDSKPAAILQSRENIKAYFDGLQRDFAADVAAISDMDGLEHLRPRKEARESAPGVES